MGIPSARKERMAIIKAAQNDGLCGALRWEMTQKLAKTMKILPERWPPVLDESLDALFEKRDSKRKNALSSLIQEFMKNKDNLELQDFVAKNFVTIVYHCLNSIKKGSSKEVYLAARLLALASLTTIPGSEIAQEIFQESVSPISEALKSNNFEPRTKSGLIDCLAIITFLGGLEKTEEIHEATMTLGYLAKTEKPSSSALSTIASLVAAVSLLLTTMDKVAISANIWLEPICFLLTVLEEVRYTSLWVAAAEAVAVIFEIPVLKDSLTSPNFTRDDLKGKVVERMLNLDREYVYKTDAIFKFLQCNYIPQESSECTMKTWSEFLQMKFLKHVFCGDLIIGQSFKFRMVSEDKKSEDVDDDVEMVRRGLKCWLLCRIEAVGDEEEVWCGKDYKAGLMNLLENPEKHWFCHGNTFIAVHFLLSIWCAMEIPLLQFICIAYRFPFRH